MSFAFSVPCDMTKCGFTTTLTNSFNHVVLFRIFSFLLCRRVCISLVEVRIQLIDYFVLFDSQLLVVITWTHLEDFNIVFTFVLAYVLVDSTIILLAVLIVDASFMTTLAVFEISSASYIYSVVCLDCIYKSIAVIYHLYIIIVFFI